MSTEADVDWSVIEAHAKEVDLRRFIRLERVSARTLGVIARTTTDEECRAVAAAAYEEFWGELPEVRPQVHAPTLLERLKAWAGGA